MHVAPCALLRICPGLSTTLSTAHTWAQAATTSPEPEISTLHRAGLGWAGLGWLGWLGWAGLLSPRISLRGLKVCGAGAGWWRLVSRWAGGGWLAGPRHLRRHTRGCLVTGTTRGQILTTKRDEDDGLTIDESF